MPEWTAKRRCPGRESALAAHFPPRHPSWCWQRGCTSVSVPQLFLPPPVKAASASGGLQLVASAFTPRHKHVPPVPLPTRRHTFTHFDFFFLQGHDLNTVDVRLNKSLKVLFCLGDLSQATLLSHWSGSLCCLEQYSFIHCNSYRLARF